MRVSAKCDYTCRAILELTFHWPSKEPLTIQTIAEKQDIPIRYLVQILIQLKQQKLVTSSRGKQGGYHLVKAPDKIMLGSVIREIAGPLLPVAEGVKTGDKTGVFGKIWDQVESSISDVVDHISFADIKEKAQARSQVINYTI